MSRRRLREADRLLAATQILIERLEDPRFVRDPLDQNRLEPLTPFQRLVRFCTNACRYFISVTHLRRTFELWQDLRFLAIDVRLVRAICRRMRGDADRFDRYFRPDRREPDRRLAGAVEFVREVYRRWLIFFRQSFEEISRRYRRIVERERERYLPSDPEDPEE